MLATKTNSKQPIGRGVQLAFGEFSGGGSPWQNSQGLFMGIFRETFKGMSGVGVCIPMHEYKSPCDV